jgi:hypothetical protein
VPHNLRLLLIRHAALMDAARALHPGGWRRKAA